MFVRDDDVFKLSKNYSSQEQVINRFKQVHQIIANEGAIHIVGIICGTLNEFPTGINFLKETYNAKELIPEIHGWKHIDYSQLTLITIIEHLKLCIDIINSNFDYNPTKFYTPWGANAPHIKEASDIVGLKMIDCSNVLYPKRKYFNGKMWKEYSHLVRSEQQELFIHWYQNRWFNTESHNLIKTLKTIRENKNIFFN